MHRELVTILPSSSVHEAALKMKEQGVGSVLVVEEGWKLRGILTDRDISMTLAADSKDPKTTYAGDIMTIDPITINADADIDSALRIMNRANIRRSPVTENGKLVGLLSSTDVAAEIKEELITSSASRRPLQNTDFKQGQSLVICQYV
ncbi:MAG TPA: CBS domain-containing protein [Nitrospiraceae bacterium]|nr:CBS domain-containing protein [Nitrospiraceae bacterium]